MAFASTFLWQFYITWFPTYLIEKRGLPVQEASYYAGLPFLCGFAATWVGGIITDYLTRRFDARRGRLYLGCAGLLLTGTLMSMGVFSPLPRAGALLMAVAAGTIDLYLGRGMVLRRGYRRPVRRRCRRLDERFVQLRRLRFAGAYGLGVADYW